MRDVLVQCLRRRLYTELTSEELLDEEIVERNRANRPVGIVPAYELRYKRWKGANENGVIGKMSANTWREVVNRQLDDFEAQLKIEQPAGDWRLVAALVDPHPLTRAVPIGGVAKQNPDVVPLTDASKNPDGTITFRQEVGGYAGVPDFRWSIQLAYADISQSDIVDPAMTNAPEGFKSNRYTQYVEHRQLRYMPEGLRKNRRQATDLIKLFAQTGARLAEAELVQTQLEEQAPPPRQGISAEQLAVAADMRRKDVPIAMIATLLSVPTDALELALDRLAPFQEGVAPPPNEPTTQARRGRNAKKE